MIKLFLTLIACIIFFMVAGCSSKIELTVKCKLQETKLDEFGTFFICDNDTFMFIRHGEMKKFYKLKNKVRVEYDVECPEYMEFCQEIIEPVVK